jgi:LysM repeat protein
MIFLKNIDTDFRSWFIFDDQRSTYNVVGETLKIQSSAAETSVDSVDFLSNGFKIRHDSSSSSINDSGDTYIYCAVAKNPFKYANAR